MHAPAIQPSSRRRSTDMDFDVDRYLRASGKLDLTGLDWTAVPRHPVLADLLRQVIKDEPSVLPRMP